MSRKFKRLLVLSDFHCGHYVGLTPPQWQVTKKREKAGNLPHGIRDTQARLWRSYRQAIDELRPIDFCVLNGDAIDGKGERSGSTELLTADREEQARMAVRALVYVKAKEYWLTYGTPYHVGVLEDMENFVAREIGAKIGAHEWLDIYGVVFDFKHFIGGSSIPHGRGTSIAKDWLWNQLWALRDEQPKADVIIRSHVHYCFAVGEPGIWMAMTTPALQAAGTKFGARKRSNTVDLGLTVFDVYPNGDYAWEVRRFGRAVRRARATKLT